MVGHACDGTDRRQFETIMTRTNLISGWVTMRGWFCEMIELDVS